MGVVQDILGKIENLLRGLLGILLGLLGAVASLLSATLGAVVALLLALVGAILGLFSWIPSVRSLLDRVWNEVGSVLGLVRAAFSWPIDIWNYVVGGQEVNISVGRDINVDANVSCGGVWGLVAGLPLVLLGLVASLLGMVLGLATELILGLVWLLVAIFQWIPGVKAAMDCLWGAMEDVWNFAKNVLSWPGDIINCLLGSRHREVDVDRKVDVTVNVSCGGIWRLVLGLPLVLLGAVASLVSIVLGLVVGLVLGLIWTIFALLQWIPGVKGIADSIRNLAENVLRLTRDVLSWPMDIINWLLGSVSRDVSSERGLNVSISCGSIFTLVVGSPLILLSLVASLLSAALGIILGALLGLVGALLSAFQWIPGVKSAADCIWDAVKQVIDSLVVLAFSWPGDVINCLLGHGRREIQVTDRGINASVSIDCGGIARLALGSPLILLASVASLVCIALQLVVGLVLGIVWALFALLQWIPGVKPLANNVWNLAKGMLQLTKDVLSWPMDVAHCLLGSRPRETVVERDWRGNARDTISCLRITIDLLDICLLCSRRSRDVVIDDRDLEMHGSIGYGGALRLVLGLPLIVLGLVGSVVCVVLGTLVSLIIGLLWALFALLQWIPGVKPFADAVWNLAEKFVDLTKDALSLPAHIINCLLGSTSVARETEREDPESGTMTENEKLLS